MVSLQFALRNHRRGANSEKDIGEPCSASCALRWVCRKLDRGLGPASWLVGHPAIPASRVQSASRRESKSQNCKTFADRTRVFRNRLVRGFVQTRRKVLVSGMILARLFFWVPWQGQSPCVKAGSGFWGICFDNVFRHSPLRSLGRCIGSASARAESCPSASPAKDFL